MNETKKIPLWAAILISINIVIGAGFFLSVNTVFNTSGLLAPLIWIACGLLLLPLVQVLAKLSNLYPTAGGIYVYSKKTLGDTWGFLSGWGYFVGNAAGNAIILHAFGDLAKKMGLALPGTNLLPPLASQLIFDLFLVIFFTAINLFNVTFLEKLNLSFTILKAIPIVLVLGAALFLFDFSHLTSAPIQPEGFLSNMPIVLFAYIGIEACCSIAHTIEDGKRNTARAMLISFTLVIATYSLVQFGLIGLLGIQHTNPFLSLMPHLTSNPTLIAFGNFMIKIAILSSYLGGFYGMFYTNSWNLYAMAEEKRILFASYFLKRNRYHAPWWCILFQGSLVVFFLLLAYNSLETLMTMNGFGVVIAYILSAIAYLVIMKKNKQDIRIGLLALIGCITLLGLCFHDLINDGIVYLLPFLGILGGGLLLRRNEQ